MSCFKLTKKVCKGITSSMAQYWWSSSLDRRSLHWVSWKSLASPKIKGGMGFRDLELFNLALLGKHGWKFMMNPGSLCARIMKTRYFPETDFLHATVPRSASPIWRAIVEGREALQVGLIKRVGSGRSISVWDDKWIPETVRMAPMFRPINSLMVTVNDLIDEENWSWRADLIRDTFLPPDAKAILNIPIRNGGGEDFFAWAFEKSGIYSVKLAYHALVNQKERAACYL